MKKFVMGIVVGAMLMFSTQIFADVKDFVGKRVGSVMKVTLDGEELGQAIVVDSTSHLPVRALATALGVEVEFVGETREIHLTTNIDKIKKTVELENAKIAAERELEKAESLIANYDRLLDFRESAVKNALTEDARKEAQEKLEALKVDHASALEELPSLIEKVEAIEKELAELNK